MWKLSPELLDEMLAHARACYPREACGVLLGQDDCVQRHYPARNVAPGNEHFLLDPAEQRIIFAEMARQRWKLLAIYHSHPRRDASPSRNDLRLSAYPHALFIIISLADWNHPDIRGYHIRNGQAREVPLEGAALNLSVPFQGQGIASQDS
jgi:proteasome lid subunit RPN8/RPN11